MKEVLLIFLTYFITSAAFGQTFTIKDFESFLKMNQDDFETAIMKKKFVFAETAEDEYDCHCITYEYAYGRNANNSSASKFISLYVFKSGKRGVGYQTLDQSEYVKLKNSLKLSGYILDRNVRSEDGTTIYYFYKKGKTNLTINTSVTKSDSEIINTYFLTFDNK